MGNKLNSIINVIKSITNPKQAIEIMLSKIPNQQAQLLKQMMNSKSPQQAITEMAQQGKITLQQLQEAKNYYSLARKFGVKIQIPDEVWSQAETAITSNNQKINPGQNNGFRF